MESRVRLPCNKQLEVSCAYPLWSEPPSPHSPSIQKEPKKHMHIVDAGCVSQELSSSIHSTLSVQSLEATHCSGAGLHKLLGSHSLAHCSGAGLLKLLAIPFTVTLLFQKAKSGICGLLIKEVCDDEKPTNGNHLTYTCLICILYVQHPCLNSMNL